MTTRTASQTTQSRFPSLKRDLTVEIDRNRSGLFETLFTVRASALPLRESVRTVKFLALQTIGVQSAVLVQEGVVEIPAGASAKEVNVKWDIQGSFNDDVVFTTCAYVDFYGEVTETNETNNADCFTGTLVH